MSVGATGLQEVSSKDPCILDGVTPHGQSGVVPDSKFERTDEGWLLGHHPKFGAESMGKLREALNARKHCFAFTLRDCLVILASWVIMLSHSSLSLRDSLFGLNSCNTLLQLSNRVLQRLQVRLLLQPRKMLSTCDNLYRHPKLPVHRLLHSQSRTLLTRLHSLRKPALSCALLCSSCAGALPTT